MFLYILGGILVLIIIAIWTNFDIVAEINEVKGYQKYEGGMSKYIPGYGIKEALERETISHIFDDSFQALVGVKRLIGIFIRHLITLILIVAVVVPVAYFFGVSSVFRLVFSIFVVIVLWLTHSSITGEVYQKKGYSKVAGNFIGLIPVYGMIQAFKLNAKKQIFKGSFRAIIGVKEIFMKILTFGFLTLAAGIVAFPVVYLIGSSFTNTTTLPTLLWPTSDLFTLQNYADLFAEDSNFIVWYKNTFIIAVLSMILGIIFVTGAGYVFARFRFKGKKAGLMTILVLQMFPSFMGLIAMFTLFQVFGLLGKPTWLTVLYVGGSIPGNMWLIKGYLSQIPKDLDESAMLDGANKFQIFFKIILPLSVPILSFVSVGLFMAPWMDYMLPKYLLDVQLAGTDSNTVARQWTIAVGLFSYISNPQSSSYTTFAAGALIVAVPITILYMIFQRYLIEGIAAGATKG